MVIAAVIGGATYVASAATTRSGVGSAAVAGYQISDVHFAPDGQDPRNLSAVSFSLDQAPQGGAEARVQLFTAGPWHTCRLDGTRAVCGTPGTPLASVDRLAVSVDG